jgi:rhamnulose-1-phosphate aldolase
MQSAVKTVFQKQEEMTGNPDNPLSMANGIFLKRELQPLFHQVAEVAQYLWERGWAERNAGNFSINITGYFTSKECDSLQAFPLTPLAKTYPGLSRKVFIISGTGTRMRDMAKDPTENICLACINDTGSAYHIITRTDVEIPVRPTSELATHLAIQQQLVEKKATEKVIIHAHVTELVALTQLPAFTSEYAINKVLWGMHPETLLFLPDGVGFIPFTLPGSESIALATLKGFETRKVVLWEKHGCMTVGNSIAEAFDHLDLLAKSAKIYFLCRSAGTEPEGLTAAQLQEIRDSGVISLDDYNYLRFMI